LFSEALGLGHVTSHISRSRDRA